MHLTAAITDVVSLVLSIQAVFKSLLTDEIFLVLMKITVSLHITAIVVSSEPRISLAFVG